MAAAGVSGGRYAPDPRIKTSGTFSGCVTTLYLRCRFGIPDDFSHRIIPIGECICFEETVGGGCTCASIGHAIDNDCVVTVSYEDGPEGYTIFGMHARCVGKPRAFKKIEDWDQDQFPWNFTGNWDDDMWLSQ